MRAAIFKVKDTTVKYDGRELTHIKGPRNMFVIAQAECDLIKKRLDPEVQLTYQPDPVNDTAEILIKRYKGQMVRLAAAQKVSPDRVY